MEERNDRSLRISRSSGARERPSAPGGGLAGGGVPPQRGPAPAAQAADNRCMATGCSSPELVGRADELAALEAAYERAAGGSPAMVLVAGDSGVGKSRLVAEFAASAERAGAR